MPSRFSFSPSGRLVAVFIFRLRFVIAGGGLTGILYRVSN
jgi:hypothetical protein